MVTVMRCAVAALGGLAAAATSTFHAVDPVAALLLLPFVGWTCFASVLLNCALATGDAEVGMWRLQMSSH